MNCLNSHQYQGILKYQGILLQAFQLLFLDLFTTNIQKGIKLVVENITKVILREKLVYLRNQYLRCTGGLITLIIHATILTTSRILKLPYTQMLVLQVGKLPMEYIHLEVSGIRQNQTILMFWIGIYTYCKNKNLLHARIMCDNVTAIAYVNNVGGIKYGIWNMEYGIFAMKINCGSQQQT